MSLYKDFDVLRKKKTLNQDIQKLASAEYYAHAMSKKHSPLKTESFHIVDKAYKADINVYFTDKEVEADLLVYISNYPNRAKGKDEVWCYSEQAYGAETLIYPVEKPFMADLKVHIVDQEYRARWIKKKKVVTRYRKCS